MKSNHADPFEGIPLPGTGLDFSEEQFYEDDAANEKEAYTSDYDWELPDEDDL